MKILVFAHSGVNGGAENALRYLVSLLRLRHEVHLVIPNGSESDYYRNEGLNCFEMPFSHSLPNFSSAVLHYAHTNFEAACRVLAAFKFDLAISNTIAIMPGALIAQKLEIAHLFYAHELLDGDMSPTGISPKTYQALLEDLTDGIISCSETVAQQFSERKRSSLSVLEPYNYQAQAIFRDYDRNAENVIQVIGTQSDRKNIDFAVTLCKSLLLRGTTVRLDIIGTENNASSRLTRVLAKRNIPYRMVPHQVNPFALNCTSRLVTLVTSIREPYGLTIPESLRLGIPVLASMSGGPQEILPDEWLYPVNDLDQAVRKVEHIFQNYEQCVESAKDLYEVLAARYPQGKTEHQLDGAITLVCQSAQRKSVSNLDRFVSLLQSSLLVPHSLEQIAQHISVVAKDSGVDLPVASVLQLIEIDRQNPGAAVIQDVRAFDVVPFAMSEQMDCLYKNGFGLAIELASTYDDPGRLQMAAFIICALQEMQMDMSEPLRILALGDGIGIDTIRIAKAGFCVDYMDYDQSNMSKIATLNFEQASSDPLIADRISVIHRVAHKYDAIVCLEVIEHVSSPREFASNIAEYLADQGVLFISECFNGIENRWPTHLQSNEKYAGSLPWLLQNEFSMIGCNHLPYGKPYVFAKRIEKNDVLLSMDRMTKIVFINNQLDIGV